MFEKVYSPEDEIRGLVRYRLPGDRYVCVDAAAVREHGAEKILRHYGYTGERPSKRLDVYQAGRKVGTLPADFDPDFIKSQSWLYEPRSGDFRKVGDRWEANRMLGPGDLNAVPGFRLDLPPE